MWSRGSGRREAAALRGAGAEGGRGQRRLTEEVGVGGPGRSEGKVCFGGGGRCVGGGGGVEGRGVKFKAWPGLVQAEGRGAREGI